MSNMTLSEAMKLGSMTGPQVFDGAFDFRTSGSCAMGSVAIATGHRYCGADGWKVIIDTFPILRQRGLCPVERCKSYPSTTVQSTIVHLNDDHRWTREQIADWIETLEKKQNAVVEQPALIAVTV